MDTTDEPDGNIGDWLLSDLSALTAQMEDGRYLRDLKEIGTTLCEFDRKTTLNLMEQRGRAESLKDDLESVLPYYLPLLKDCLDAHGEETYLTADQCAELLAKHNLPPAPATPPRLALESGHYGYALLQAAAMLASVDDTLVGPWYLRLQEDLARAQGAIL